MPYFAPSVVFIVSIRGVNLFGNGVGVYWKDCINGVGGWIKAVSPGPRASAVPCNGSLK